MVGLFLADQGNSRTLRGSGTFSIAKKAKVDGILVTFLGAFSAATQGLLENRQFLDLVERKPNVSDALARPLPREKTIPDEIG